MKTLPISIACLLALTGCQTLPDQLPRAEPAPSASCHFSIGDTPPSDVLTQSVALLENWGFELDSTDTELGLVSASKERDLVGYYDPYDNGYRYGSGMRIFGGFGIGRGSSVGVGLGGGIGRQPVESERVSVLVHNAHMRISRDIRRFDHLRDMRESRTASADDFCQRFQSALPTLARPGRRL
ncbi:hypothetical protein [Vreelandella sp. EE22]